MAAVAEPLPRARRASRSAVESEEDVDRLRQRARELETRGPQRTDPRDIAGVFLQRRLAAAEEELRRLRSRVVEQEEAERRLLARIDELERAGKRQASPFSKGDPRRKPKTPGRKPGPDYGERHFRPRPAHVDEEIDVPLPDTCPHCGGEVEEVETAEQFQTDVRPPPPPITRRFCIHLGACAGCGRRVQPRHPLQTSDALGAAAVQLGPRVIALAVLLNKGYGMSWGKVASFTERVFHLRASRATYCRASMRLAGKLEPTHEGLIQALRKASHATPDETGWRVGGHRRWLWTFVGPTITVYVIAASRGADVVCAVLGENFAGRVTRDGWVAYRCLKQAIVQSCLGHLMRRAHEILEVAKRGQAKFAHALLRLFKAALALRDRRAELTDHGFASRRGKIEAKLDWLLTWRPTYEPNRKFRNHLERERPYLLTFLHDSTVQATNWAAEQALRGLAVMARKLSGCSRSDRGAKAHAIHISVIRTAGQQKQDPLSLFVSALLAREPRPLPLLPPPAT